MKRELILDELEAIRSANPQGLLNPEEVVEFARNPNTVLHSKFNWDDTEAAKLYRLHQARSVIRVAVNVLTSPEGAKIIRPAFVSLSDSRGPEGGYQPLAVVITDEEKRRRHVDDVLNLVVSLMTKANLTELQPVLDVALATRERIAMTNAA